MPALAVPLEERTFREGITNYVAAQCRVFRVRRQDVDDLIQESLTTIFASLGTFRAEEGNLEAWARGVAYNVIRRYLRNVKRYGDRFSEYHPNVNEHPTPAPSPERCAQHAQARSSLATAAEGMKSIHVQVLVFHAVDDMPHGAIARILSISEEKSKKCYQRARDRFAQCLDRDLLSVLPPSLTSCDEPFSSHEKGFRWTERSHYASQIIASVIALFLVISSGFEPQIRAPMTEKTRVLGLVHNASMYRFDELMVHHDTPSGKPEPGQMTSVRDVPTPSKRADKLPPRSEYVPRLSRKHEPNDPDRRPNGR